MKYLLLLSFFSILSCRQPSNFSNQNSYPSTYSTETNNSDMEISEAEIISFIDEYGGHPSDSTLPENALGATDIVLQSTNPRELADVLKLGLEVAKKNAKQMPRLQFALGRIAYELGYDKRAVELFEESARNGSAPANYYLGYIYINEGRESEGREKIKFAAANKFGDYNSDDGTELFPYTFYDFNIPDYVEALYNNDLEFLLQEQHRVLASYYIGTIQNTLWETDILFLVENADFILNLDPIVSVNLGFISNEAKSFKWLPILRDFLKGSGESDRISLITDQAVQDARRLAIMYGQNPEAFNQIYATIVKFSKQPLNFN